MQAWRAGVLVAGLALGMSGQAMAQERPARDGWSRAILIEDEVLVPVAWRADFKPPRAWAAYSTTELIVPDDWRAWAPHWPSHPDGSLLVPRGW